MASLTEGIVRARMRLEGNADLDTVTALNAWGLGLSDVSMLRHLPALQILSLSVNAIDSLRDLEHCKALRELYLRKNSIAAITELRFLMGLPELRTLWLEGNPVALHPHYREAVLVNLRQVTTLDDRPVTESERDAAAAALPHELWLLCCGAGEDAQEGAVASGRGCSSGGIAKDVPSPALSRESKRVTALYDDNSCDVESFWMEQALQLPPHEDRQQDAPQLGMATPRRAPASPAVLYAVIALLEELDESQLGIVAREVGERICRPV